MESTQNIFRQISEEQAKSLPFSLQHRWWEEVVKTDWEVSSFAENGEIKAIWPYFVRKKGPWKMLCMPAFTPYGGPIILYPEGQKQERRYSYEQKILKALIDELPEFSELLINCRMDLINTLPFIWEGFEDRKKFTYLLDLNRSEEDIWSGFRENIRRQIRKAEKSIKVDQAKDAAQMGELLRQSFAGQPDEYPIQDEGIYQRIFDYLKKYDCGEFLQARDEKGDLHAGLVWLYDQRSAYYLIGGAASKHKNSGAMSLLMWEAIIRSKAIKGRPFDQFNFEGSMIPSVEKYLRGFGGELSPYSCLIKNNSASLKVLRKLKK